MAADAKDEEGTEARADDAASIPDDQRAEVVAPIPPPPPPPGQHLQVALGMQLMHQTALERLPVEVQHEMIRVTDQMDNRNYQYALKSLDKDTEIQKQVIEDRGNGRKQILWVVSGITALVLVVGTIVTCMFIYEKQYTLAHTVMMSGLAVISALLGGAGLSAVLQKFSGGK